MITQSLQWLIILFTYIYTTLPGRLSQSLPVSILYFFYGEEIGNDGCVVKDFEFGISSIFHGKECPK